MALFPDYCTAAQLKSLLRITDATDDAELGYAITAASRIVDQETGRQFGLAGAAEPRYYTAHHNRRTGRWFARIDDLQTTTGLVVKIDDGGESYPTTLTLNTDFRLRPYNAALDGLPWTALVGARSQDLGTGPVSLEVTGRFGWSSVPTLVVQATLLQASRIFKRRDAPFGVAGSPETGSELRLLAKADPDVMVMLDPLRRHFGVA